ncbi:uncharacterized protein LOC6609815 [Drosophila sechellia]|uniref:GM19897 n=2 Tax=melanogaster subgroup TaxID=32351 RepID=B4HNR3_DROSE|nr:uncharacterized protein LOC6609815 [Drosophila sechellia]XP_033151639.1 uncharacterized protein LOC117135512 isoform X1 [Drosophila mauritiana]EDW48482.1 GM19897 [Drosophila sechellia]
MCLRLFCGYLSLYIGCIFIGFTGMLLALMVFSVGLFEMIKGNPETLLVVMAMVFGIVQALAKILLLLGTMWDMCWAMLLSFFIGIAALGLLIALVVLFYILLWDPLHLLLGAFLSILEMYYEWVIISTWWCCRSCTHDC